MLAAIVSGMALAQGTGATVRPGDDFYRYANGDWLKTTPLPEGRAAYDTNAMLKELAARRVQDLVDAAAGARTKSRVGDFYAGWMDTAGIEAKGVQPLAGDLATIAAIRNRRALATYLGRTLRTDDGTNTQTDGLFGVWFHQGFHDPDHYAPHLVQGGLGLSEREDYLDAGAANAAGRAHYRAHIAEVLRLAGLGHSEVRAGRILALEVAIARTHATADDTADVFKTDNTWSRADFAAKAPGLDWPAWFKAAGLGAQDAFVVWQPSAVTGAAALVHAQPLVAWKDYLSFHLIAHYAAVLPKAFGEEDAAFQGRLAGGVSAAPDRAKQAIAATNAALGDDIARPYVAKFFPPQAKAEATVMVENIRAAFRARIARSTWMSSAMREMTLAKLAAVKVEVGYPAAWIDYSGLSVRRGDAYGNLRRAEAFAYQRGLASLRRPVDPAEWSTVRPQNAGALINFSPNALQFSAGLLQPPFFDPSGDAASNYGSAGAGMAHEISHSFDELGSLYDAQGRLIRWWTPEDKSRYRAALAPLAAQFAFYCPKPNLCVNGAQVLGENSADLAGLLVAHDAYRLSLGGKPDTFKDGRTGDQRFFMAFAQRWRKLQTDAALRQQIATDTHAPGEYRADTVRNLDAWVRAYDVKPGDYLYLPPEARFQIWGDNAW